MSQPPTHQALSEKLTALEKETKRLRHAEQRLTESEDRFLRLSEIAEEGIMIHDKGVIVDANQALTRLFGYSYKELMGMHSSRLLSGESWQTVCIHMANNYKRAFEVTGVRKDGSQFIGRTLGKPYQFKDGQLRVIVLNDISELKEAQAQLAKSEKRYRSLFKYSGAPSIIVNDALTVIMSNPKFWEISEYTKDELQGKVNCLNLFEQDGLKAMLDRILKKESPKPTTKMECRLKCKSGNIKDVAFQMGKIPDIQQFIISLTDITERKKAEALLRERELLLIKENRRLKYSMKGKSEFSGIIGQGPAMRKVFNVIMEAASSDAGIIIYGESGTGKELVARAIHDMSERSDYQFVPINCGAIPENILETELFGYKKGAFTGAMHNKRGILDSANQGTLFMDEIGDISLNMQVKLLRALEGSGYTPVGENSIHNSDFRIIAATNKDLSELVKQGDMRKDFFYRIHVIPIHLPPLRERLEDIPLLADYFLKLFTKKGKTPQISDAMFEALTAYHWPGNVRELQNVIHRFVTLKRLDLTGPLGKSPTQTRRILTKELKQDSKDTTLNAKIADFERNLLLQALTENQWHQGLTAQKLGIDRRTLYNKLKRYGIKNTQNGN